MRWRDRVYGESVIDDEGILALIACPEFERLKRIRQAGPSVFAHPFKTVTRFEHSLGVYLLLRRLGADRREQVAGLLHDISHTAFSHAVDFVFSSEEQDYHERIKPEVLCRPDLAGAIRNLGFHPDEFVDDSIYPLLERPLPSLCADRIDYFLRDGIACSVVPPDFPRRLLDHLAVFDRAIVITDRRVAAETVDLFSIMNRDWWAGPTESYIYNEFADALIEALRLKILTREDFLRDDDRLMSLLLASDSPLIREKLARVQAPDVDLIASLVPRVTPKTRWLDPPVLEQGVLKRYSETAGTPPADRGGLASNPSADG